MERAQKAYGEVPGNGVQDWESDREPSGGVICDIQSRWCKTPTREEAKCHLQRHRPSANKLKCC